MFRVTTRVKRWTVIAIAYVAIMSILGPAAEAAFHLDRADGTRPLNGLHVSGLVTAPQEPLGAPINAFLPKPVYRPRSEPVALPVAPAAPVARPVAHVSQGGVAARVAAAWPGDDSWALKTVACESGFDPMQIGGGGNNYYGLFQMGPWARGIYGNPLNQSVEAQTASAWRLLKDEGSGQWSCSPWSYHP